MIRKSIFVSLIIVVSNRIIMSIYSSSAYAIIDNMKIGSGP
jgi:hypothetical protein